MGEQADYLIDSLIDGWAEESVEIDNLTRRLTDGELWEFTAGASVIAWRGGSSSTTGMIANERGDNDGLPMSL